MDRGRKVFVVGCAAVGACALLLRLEFLAAYRQSPLFENLFIDAETYHRWASLLASGEDWTGGGVYPRAPLYIWFLALLHKLSGSSLLFPRMVQAVMGALSCVLLAVLGRRFLSPGEALGGALLAALSWPLIFFDGQLLYPALIVFLELLFLLALPAGDEGGLLRYLLAGTLLGLLSLVNPLAFLLLPVFGVTVFLRRRRKGGRPLLTALSLVVGSFLALAPVAARNHLAGGGWTVVSANGGYNFFVGNNGSADGLSVWASEEAIRGEGVLPPDPAGASRHYYRRALGWIQGNPAAAAALSLRKAYYLVNAREIPSNYLLDRMREIVPSRAGRLALLHFGIIAPLALTGCLFALRIPGARPLLIFLACGAVGPVLFFVNTRYRVPLLPPLYLMAAHGIALLLRGLRGGWRSFLTVLIPVFLFALLVNSRGWGVGERRQEAPLYGELARALARSGETAPAVTELRTALALAPSRKEDRYLLASLLIQQGEVDEGRLQLRRVLDEDPRHYRAWNSLGSLSLLAGNDEEAIGYYRRALEIQPDYGLAARNLREAQRLRGP